MKTAFALILAISSCATAWIPSDEPLYSSGTLPYGFSSVLSSPGLAYAQKPRSYIDDGALGLSDDIYPLKEKSKLPTWSGAASDFKQGIPIIVLKNPQTRCSKSEGQEETAKSISQSASSLPTGIKAPVGMAYHLVPLSELKEPQAATPKGVFQASSPSILNLPSGNILISDGLKHLFTQADGQEETTEASVAQVEPQQINRRRRCLARCRRIANRRRRLLCIRACNRLPRRAQAIQPQEQMVLIM